MEAFEFTIEKLRVVLTGVITRERPYIPPEPREHSSIAFVTDGVLLYTVGTRTHRIEPGGVLVVTPGEVDISACEGERVEYIYFDFDARLPSFGADGLRRVNYPTNPEEIYALFSEAKRIYDLRDFGCMPYCISILYRIITRLAESNFNGTDSYYKYSRIRPAIQKLESDFALPVTVDGLAHLCSMSAGNLTRLFGELTGSSPIEYLTRTRVENAKRLLRTGAYNVSEIAVMCGFASIYSFSRAFKRLCGVSPSRYTVSRVVYRSMGDCADRLDAHE